MHNQVVYIAYNDGKPDLPILDMNEIKPLPAFQKQSVVEADAGQNTSFLQFQSIGLILLAVIFVICILYVCLKLYRQLKNRYPAVSLSNLLSLQNEKANGENVDEQAEGEIANELQIPVIDDNDKKVKKSEKVPSGAGDNYMLAESQIYIVKLGTPKSVAKCIKGFLEITLDK